MHRHRRSLAAAKLVIPLVCVSLAFPARADGLTAGATDKVALEIPADAVLIALGGIGSWCPTSSSRSSPRRSAAGAGERGGPLLHDSLAGRSSPHDGKYLSNLTGFVLAPAAALAGALVATGPHATPDAGFARP